MKDIISRHSDHFLTRIFTAEELAEGEVKNLSPQYFSGRWAVKEALAKAMGCGIGKNCRWLDIVTTNQNNGKPVVRLAGATREHAEFLGVDNIHASISHDHLYVFSVVILESDNRNFR